MTGTRAVLRQVGPCNGNPENSCTACGDRISFSARTKQVRVIANCYEDGRWNRVEHYHADCYSAAGEPYGEASA